MRGNHSDGLTEDAKKSVNEERTEKHCALHDGATALGRLPDERHAVAEGGLDALHEIRRRREAAHHEHGGAAAVDGDELLVDD